MEIALNVLEIAGLVAMPTSLHAYLAREDLPSTELTASINVSEDALNVIQPIAPSVLHALKGMRSDKMVNALNVLEAAVEHAILEISVSV